MIDFFLNCGSIYEILSLGESNNFSFEYAIKIVNNILIKDTYSLNNYIFDFIMYGGGITEGYYSSAKDKIIIIDLSKA